MSTVNKTRVVCGGLVAGLLMNVGKAALHGGILGADSAQLFARYQLADRASPVAFVSLILMTFVLGIASVWLYAAIRPRYGAGARTAIIAGLAIWTTTHLWAGVYIGMGFMGLVPSRLAFLPVAWGLVEAPLATLAGAWMYKEGRNEGTVRMGSERR